MVKITILLIYMILKCFYQIKIKKINSNVIIILIIMKYIEKKIIKKKISTETRDGVQENDYFEQIK